IAAFLTASGSGPYAFRRLYSLMYHPTVRVMRPDRVPHSWQFVRPSQRLEPSRLSADWFGRCVGVGRRIGTRAWRRSIAWAIVWPSQVLHPDLLVRRSEPH